MTRSEVNKLLKRIGKRVRFYKSGYIPSFCEPIVITTLQNSVGHPGCFSEVFVLFPKVRNRELTFIRATLDHPIDQEAVDIDPVRLRKKEIRRLAAGMGKKIINQKTDSIANKRKVQDQTLFQGCELRCCSARILIHLWMQGFTKETLEAVRNVTTSSALKELLDLVLRYPRVLAQNNPYESQ